MNDIRLNACPNCGGTPKLHRKGKNGKMWFECDGDCWTQTDKYWSKQEVISAWNNIKPSEHNDDLNA